jgi:hypothetical protein
MQPVTSKKAPQTSPSRFARAVWIALGALVALSAAMLFWLTRTKDKPRPSAHAPVTTKGTYKNRSLLPVSAEAGEKAPAKRHVIIGNVYATDGAVIPGATVVAVTFDKAGNMPSPAGAARTDASGRFEIPLPEGTYQLNANMEGFGPTAVTAQTGDTISMVLPKSGVIRGHVRDERGNPMRRFTIDVLSVVPGDAPAPPPIWSRRFETTDGSFQVGELPSWPVFLRATAEEHAPALSHPVNVRAGDSREVDLAVTDGCTLNGKVVDKKGNPLSGVLINAEERVIAGSASDPSLQTSTQAQSGDDGSFSLDHVPRGTLLVRGYDGDFAVTTVTTEIKDCENVSPVKIVMSHGGTVTGIARDAAGKPLSGAHLTITDRSIGFVNAVSGPDGRFRFDQIPEGAMRLELEHEGRRALRFIGVNDGQVTTQDMTLFAAGNGELKGKVTAGKKPIAGARLLVAANHGQEAGIAIYFPVTGEDGTFRIPQIPEGNYLVSVMSTSAGTGVRVNGGEAANVDLDAGFLPPTSDMQPRPSRRREAQAPQGAQEAQPQQAPTPSP